MGVVVAVVRCVDDEVVAMVSSRKDNFDGNPAAADVDEGRGVRGFKKNCCPSFPVALVLACIIMSCKSLTVRTSLGFRLASSALSDVDAVEGTFCEIGAGMMGICVEMVFIGPPG